MKIDDNGKIREMTAEEITEFEKDHILLEPNKTDLEKQVDELTLMMAELLGGVQ